MPSLAQMLAGGENYSDPEAKDADDMGEDLTAEDDHKAVSREMLDAMNSGDHEGFHHALKAFVGMCKD